MKHPVRALAAAVLFAAALFAFQNSPLLSTVDPDTGKEGDTVSAKGQSLGKKAVGELYLTDGKHDVKTVILEQADDEIKFKVPKIGAGRSCALAKPLIEAFAVDHSDEAALDRHVHGCLRRRDHSR